MFKFVLLAALLSYVKADCGSCENYMAKEPLCAFDGTNYQTLENACVFKVMACKYNANGMTLQIAYKGECTRTQNVKPIVSTNSGSLTNDCSRLASCTSTEPLVICGTDGNTYQNKCEFSQAECKYRLSGKTLNVDHMGDCGKIDTSGLAIETGTNTLNDRCYMNCGNEKYPICASDGYTYQNKCVFYQAKCRIEANKGSLDFVSLGECGTDASLGTSVIG